MAEAAQQQRVELPPAIERVVADREVFLPNIFGYVGPAQWFFVAPVCKLWYELYSEPGPQVQEFMGEESYLHSRIRTTHVKSAFTSVNRLLLAYKHGLPAWTQQTQFYAGLCASQELLQAAHSQGWELHTWSHDSFMNGAAESGDLAKLQWLHAQLQRPLNMATFYHASRSGCMDLLRWFRLQQPEYDGLVAAANAAGAGKLLLVQQLQARGNPLHSSVASAAARAGSIELLEWLQQQGCTAPAPELAAAAAQGGALNVLEWVDEKQQQQHKHEHHQQQQQQQGDELPMLPAEDLQPAYWYNAQDLCVKAVESRPVCIETLQWLHEHGDPATAAHRVEVMASKVKHPTAEVLSYLAQLGHVFDEDRLRRERLRTCIACTYSTTC
jgi:hypothetical protein